MPVEKSAIRKMEHASAGLSVNVARLHDEHPRIWDWKSHIRIPGSNPALEADVEAHSAVQADVGALRAHLADAPVYSLPTSPTSKKTGYITGAQLFDLALRVETEDSPTSVSTSTPASPGKSDIATLFTPPLPRSPSLQASLPPRSPTAQVTLADEQAAICARLRTEQEARLYLEGPPGLTAPCQLRCPDLLEEVRKSPKCLEGPPGLTTYHQQYAPCSPPCTPERRGGAKALEMLGAQQAETPIPEAGPAVGGAVARLFALAAAEETPSCTPESSPTSKEAAGKELLSILKKPATPKYDGYPKPPDWPADVQQAPLPSPKRSPKLPACFDVLMPSTAAETTICSGARTDVTSACRPTQLPGSPVERTMAGLELLGLVNPAAADVAAAKATGEAERPDDKGRIALGIWDALGRPPTA